MQSLKLNNCFVNGVVKSLAVIIISYEQKKIIRNNFQKL